MQVSKLEENIWQEDVIFFDKQCPEQQMRKNSGILRSCNVFQHEYNFRTISKKDLNVFAKILVLSMELMD